MIAYHLTTIVLWLYAPGAPVHRIPVATHAECLQVVMHAKKRHPHAIGICHEQGTIIARGKM